MLIFLFAIIAVCIVASVVREEDIDASRRTGGYPIGNFGICARITPQGHFLPELLVNPPVEGPWLQSVPGGQLSVVTTGGSIVAGSSPAQVGRRYPFVNATCQDPSAPHLTLKLRVWSPVADHDAFSTSLPCVMADLELGNSSDKEAHADLRFDWQTPAVAPWQCACGFDEGGAPRSSLSLRIPARGSSQARFLLAFHHPEGYYTSRLPHIDDLVRHCLESWGSLRSATSAFSDLLPSVGDPKIDDYLRWYVPAGIYLTRLTRKIALTMGYCELNQRDSFWTSYPHLMFWPDIELRMLQMTVENMRPDGKVPTTILPVIEREDDLDINCYFVIRTERYYEWTLDAAAISELWPSVNRALEWLASRDEDGDGLVEQQSYWADWKDVNGVEGRKHAPHFEFVWLAALRAGASLASLAGDLSAADRWSTLFDKAYGRAHCSLGSGGLWNGRFYECVWRDGRSDPTVQQDQMVGAFLGVIPPDRVPSVIESLQPSMSPWGVRETWPYRQPFSNEGGDYHNGGIWPFLSFVDAAARAMHGFPEQCEQVLKTTGFADLEQFGDWTPHEYLFGDTGENRGPVIQGWNACYLAAIYFGLLGIRIISKDEVEICPRIPKVRPFSTLLRLPSGVIRLERDAAARVTVSSVDAAPLRIVFRRVNVPEGAASLFTLPQGCSVDIDA